jgi:TolB-like protein
VDVRAVGQQLGVGTLLEGSVRKADDRLRVTVQLVEVATGLSPVVTTLRSQARRRVRDPG